MPVNIHPYSVVLLSLMLLLLQYGCHLGPSVLQIKLDSAVERKASIDERIVGWGAPDSKAPLSDGRVVYTWKMPWTSSGVNYAVPGGQAYSSQHLCTVAITVTSDNIVQNYNYRDC
jgi:hypothetical protein